MALGDEMEFSFVLALIMNFQCLNQLTMMLVSLCALLIRHIQTTRPNRRRVTLDHCGRARVREVNFLRIVPISDTACIENTRMDRRSFHKLCELVKTVGQLEPTPHMGVEEMVAIFLHILAHDVKNRIIKRQFMRSGETISRQFSNVLLAVLRCHTVLLKRPEPVAETSTDERWKWFKNCLGALDGTHIKINPLQADKPRYRTRKGEIATNVLGVCSQDGQFIFVLPGWEGSAADSRVLRDAIARPHGLRVPKGYYYLCDARYMNGEGFLTPYRGQRYHLTEWRHGPQPRTPQEFFNMKHSSARNVIERCFGMLKGRWAIVRSKSFYPVKTQCRIITACCLLHNHIRREMTMDPLEADDVDMQLAEDDIGDNEVITHVESSNAWTLWRDELAHNMFNTWRSRA
ncbi:protein ALP1-like isoform X1 [Gastrolobium bilobum]|uniref:protein ALP1-like isoform X1 n=1 Tax=Gastrolobium bilobum TaxID=150636 RepID=UPI002AB16D48|nr:protein ALP1-like isoform X1 [Gastrolobium bilobum]XP_061361207.1 protein ALP1-like isoform X1 [Gastrolobium bilobum]XP_061361216.1 protein ALP1-like isoform X1 [Gastrolobium bilobum]XP_061361223.1 protein ALP1-like isoform X1 [Gastrolobium bilobum]